MRLGGLCGHVDFSADSLEREVPWAEVRYIRTRTHMGCAVTTCITFTAHYVLSITSTTWGKMISYMCHSLRLGTLVPPLLAYRTIYDVVVYGYTLCEPAPIVGYGITYLGQSYFAQLPLRARLRYHLVGDRYMCAPFEDNVPEPDTYQGLHTCSAFRAFRPTMRRMCVISTHPGRRVYSIVMDQAICSMPRPFGASCVHVRDTHLSGGFRHLRI